MQSFMVVDLYKFLGKKDEFRSIECLIEILKENLSFMMMKFGLMEVYQVLVGCMVPMLSLDKKAKFDFYIGNNYVE